jgi:DNA-binding response OmpR family regulator
MWPNYAESQPEPARVCSRNIFPVGRILRAYTAVLFLSACAKPADYGEGYDAGGLRYVAKPIRPAQILQMARLYASRIEKKETI